MSNVDQKAKLGEMLLDAGLINKNQLNIALANQREWGGKLGSILVNMGFIKEEKLAQFLSHQLNIPSIDIGTVRIKPETIKLIPKELAEKYLLVPVAHQQRKNKTTVLLAMSDPLDLNAVDEIQFQLGLSVKAGIAPEGAIWRAIQIYYYDNKSISPKLDTTKDPIKIDLTDIDEHLEIFRGRDEKPKTKPILPGENGMNMDQIARELRALKNILVKKGVMSVAEFYKELEKFRE